MIESATASPKPEGPCKRFEREVNEAAERAGNAPPCKTATGRKKGSVKCGGCFGQCGFSGFPGSICVNVSFVKKGACGRGACLGSTTFHELIHKCPGTYLDEPMAWDCEKRFCGDVCKFDIPKEYIRCPSPCSD